MNCFTTFADMDTLKVLLSQERRYRTDGFLSQELLNLDVDIDCRTKMVAWCYQVVDFCKFSRESVEIALSYLDRFVMTEAGHAVLKDRNLYQLAAMTCLYTAVKVQETEAIDPRAVSTLSRGSYSPEQVEAMERRILESLQWNMHPVTSIAFVREYLALAKLDKEEHKVVFEMAKFQTELCVSDYHFCSVDRSVIAYCAVLNALESLAINEDTVCAATILLSDVTQISQNEEVVAMRTYLFASVAGIEAPDATTKPTKRQSSFRKNSMSNKQQRRSSVDTSPRSTAAATR